MAGNIFINYRRGDDPGFAQALYSRLEQAFPAERLFMDVDNIAPGLDFVQVLSDQVARCDVLIAVIGKNWLGATDETGARRLDCPEDFVRVEIESALAQKKRVIPVLVNDARMPRMTDLPESLRSFARCNAVKLSHERFKADTQGLIRSLESALAEAEASRRAEEEKARLEARARKYERKVVPEGASSADGEIDARPRPDPGSGIATWMAALPSETGWSIPLGVVGIFLLGWLLPATLFAMRFNWGLGSLLYGAAGFVAVAVALYIRRDLLGGAELALYWYAAVSALAILILSVATMLGLGGTLNSDAITLGLAVVGAAALIGIRRKEIGGVEASIYWLGLTMAAFWALLPIAAKFDWVAGTSGAVTVTESYRAAGLVLAGLILLSAAAILFLRRSRLSGPEIAIYAMGTAASFVAVLLLA